MIDETVMAQIHKFLYMKPISYFEKPKTLLKMTYRFQGKLEGHIIYWRNPMILK